MNRTGLYLFLLVLILSAFDQANAHFLWVDGTGDQTAILGGTVSVSLYLHAESDDVITRARMYIGFDDANRGGELNYVEVVDTLLPLDTLLIQETSEKYGDDTTSNRVFIYLRNDSINLAADTDYLLCTIHFTYERNDYYGREDIWFEDLDSKNYYFDSGRTALAIYTDNTQTSLLGDDGPNFDDGSAGPAFVKPSPEDGATEVMWDTTFTWYSTFPSDAYDFYLWKQGETKPETPIASGLQTMEYTPAELDEVSSYNWQVVGYEGGMPRESDIWTLQTLGTSHFLWIDKTGLQNVNVGDEVALNVYLHAAADDNLINFQLYAGFQDIDIGGELRFKDIVFNPDLNLTYSSPGYSISPTTISEKYPDDPTARVITNIQMISQGGVYEPMTAGQDLLLLTFKFTYLQNLCIPGEDLWIDSLGNKTWCGFEFETGSKIKVYVDNQKTSTVKTDGPDYDDGMASTPVLNPNPIPYTKAVLVEPTPAWEDNTDGADSFDIYLWKAGETKPGTPLSSGLTETEYTCQTVLDFYTEYFWQITAHKDGETLEGPVWRFSTYMAGDINSDEVINVEDLTKNYNFHLGNNWSSFNADVNGDGRIGGEETIYQIQKLKNLR